MPLLDRQEQAISWVLQDRREPPTSTVRGSQFHWCFCGSRARRSSDFRCCSTIRAADCLNSSAVAYRLSSGGRGSTSCTWPPAGTHEVVLIAHGLTSRSGVGIMTQPPKDKRMTTTTMISRAWTAFPCYQRWDLPRRRPVYIRRPLRTNGTQHRCCRRYVWIRRIICGANLVYEPAHRRAPTAPVPREGPSTDRASSPTR